MTYFDGTHDLVSAAELAHDRAQEKLPFWTCQCCNAELFDEDAAAQNWLVCKGCGNALCEDCGVDIHLRNEPQIYYRYTDPEPLHNLGFCSTGCLARAYERDGWEYRKGRLLGHCEEAAKDISEARDIYRQGKSDWSLARCYMIANVLIDQVRAVCKLERGKR